MKLYEVEIDEKNPITQTVNVIDGDVFMLNWISKISGKNYNIREEDGKVHYGNKGKFDGKSQTLSVRNSGNVKVLDVQVIAKKSSVRDVDGISENDVTRIITENTGLGPTGISKSGNESFTVNGDFNFDLNEGQYLIKEGVEVDRFKGVIINEGGYDTLSPDVEIPMYYNTIYGGKPTTYVFTGGTAFTGERREFTIRLLEFVDGEMSERKKRVSFYQHSAPALGQAFVMMIDWGSFVYDPSNLVIIFPTEDWVVEHATVEDITE